MINKKIKNILLQVLKPGNKMIQECKNSWIADKEKTEIQKILKKRRKKYKIKIGV